MTKPANTPRANFLRTLPAEMKAIDQMDEFVGRNTSQTEEARTLLKLAAYEELCVRLGHSAPAKNFRLPVKLVMKAIGHPRKPTMLERVALDAMGGRLLGTAPTRHDPPTAVDVALDAYETKISARGYGPPRSAMNHAAPCRAGVAKEASIPFAKLDAVAMRRLREMVASYPPGPVNQKKPSRPKLRLENPALDGLLARGLKSFPDGLPEDPLRPGELDMITITERAGIALNDVKGFPRLLDQIAAARAASGLPLVPHPLLAARRYTYGDLISSGREALAIEAGGGQARKSVNALRGFMKLAGIVAAEQDLVPYDFKERVENAIVANGGSFAHGWRSKMKKWIELNDALRATKPLPATFGLALRLLMREIGTLPNTLQSELSDLRGNVNDWSNGSSIPSVGAEKKLIAVAGKLRVPAAKLKALLRDEWRIRQFDLRELGGSRNSGKRLPFDFETWETEDKKKKLKENHDRYDWQGTEYGRHLSVVAKDQYRLGEDRWTERMKLGWSKYRPKDETRKGGLRPVGGALLPRDPDGKVIKSPEPIRETTLEMRRRLLDYALGFWHRPRERPIPLDETAPDADYVPEGGLGVPLHLLNPGIFALTELTGSYNHFRYRRAGNKATRSVEQTLIVIADLLRPKHGIVWKSPDMLKDLKDFVAWYDKNPYDSPDGTLEFEIQPFIEDWQGAVAHAFAVIQDDLERLTEEEIEPSRISFESVGVYVEHEKPVELYMVGVRALLASQPTKTIIRHVHTRDSVMALILMQTGLRTYNMMFTFDAGDGGPAKRRKGRNHKTLDPTLRRIESDGVIKWIVLIPSSEFKNWYSPYFAGKRPYEHELRNEDGLYGLLEEYTSKSRLYLLRGRKSDAFFISYVGNDMDEEALGQAYRRVASTHFIHNPDTGAGGVKGAIQHAMHAVRHVIATHIVKVTGDLHLAGWAIQDTLRTVTKHYARFIPADKVKLADRVLAEARAAGRDNDCAEAA